MKNLVLLVFMVALFSNGRAQESTSTVDSVKTYHLPEVVITATRTERDPRTVGRSVSVLFAHEVNGSVYQSVAEAIARTAGLYLVGTGQTFGAQQSLFLRGAGSHQTAVMVDDVRLTDPSGVNNALDFSELLPFGYDRLEIVRGSHSTLYGSSAVGGVVNLITRKRWTPGLHADANLWAGTDGTGSTLFGQQLFLNVTARSGLYANAEAVNVRAQGLDATLDTSMHSPNARPRDRDGMRALDLFGKVGFETDVMDAYVSFKKHRQDKDIDKAAFRDDDNATLDFTRRLLTYGLSYRFGNELQLKFTGGSSDIHRTAVDDSSVVDGYGRTDQTYSKNQWEGTTTSGELQALLRSEGIDAVIGVGLHTETMSSQAYFYSNSAFGPFEFSSNIDSLGLKATMRHLFARMDLHGTVVHPTMRQFTLGLGARVTDHSSFGNHFSVDLNPSYAVDGVGLLYGSMSMGFNAPSLFQLFAPDRDVTSGITRGNAGLQPETSVSYEIGVKTSVREGIDLRVSYFHSVVDESIEYVYLWDRDVPIDMLGTDFLRNDFRGDTYLNLGRQTTNGAEVAWRALLGDRLELSGNVSLVAGKLRYRQEEIDRTKTDGHHVQLYGNGAFLKQDVESTELVRRPNTANILFSWRLTDRWAVRLAARYAGARPDVYYDAQRGPYGALGTKRVPAYTLVDLAQTYSVHRSLSVSARVENVLNTKYLEINGFATRGRGLYLSVRYVFDSQL